MAKLLFKITLLGLAVGAVQLQQLPSTDTLSNSLGQQRQSGGGSGGSGGGLGNLLGGFTGSNNNNGGQQMPSLIPNLGSLGNMLNGGQQQQQQQQQGLGELLRSIPRRGIEMVQGLMNGVRRMLPGGRQDGQQPQQQQQSRNPLDMLNLGGNNGASSLLNLPNPFAAEGMENRPPASGLLGSITSGQPLNAISSALNLDKLSGLTDSLTNSQSRNGQAQNRN